MTLRMSSPFAFLFKYAIVNYTQHQPIDRYGKEETVCVFFGFDYFEITLLLIKYTIKII